MNRKERGCAVAVGNTDGIEDMDKEGIIREETEGDIGTNGINLFTLLCIFILSHFGAATTPL